MISTKIKTILCALVITGAFCSGWTVNGWKYEAQRAKAMDDFEKEKKTFTEKQSQNSAELEKQLSEITGRERRLKNELAKVYSRPVYHIDCFDFDGLQRINSAAIGNQPAEHAD